MVIIVFLDGRRIEYTEKEAKFLCSDKRTASKILDAITDDRELQEALRRSIDRF